MASRDSSVDSLLQGLGILSTRICDPCSQSCWRLLRESTSLYGKLRISRHLQPWEIPDSSLIKHLQI
ncbi:hypothetical protein, partial [Nostoc sp. 'Peltigera membranacea cyanobiont' 213]|uniref:hypothetical protein n=1 Tax=Nostoc sp. 'Peltigera membranacea cyanobiont' 213 TaxID=2014530 RepID=UPI001CB91689